MFDHLLDDSNKWSNIGSDEEITKVLSVKVYFMFLIRSCDDAYMYFNMVFTSMPWLNFSHYGISMTLNNINKIKLQIKCLKQCGVLLTVCILSYLFFLLLFSFKICRITLFSCPKTADIYNMSVKQL